VAVRVAVLDDWQGVALSYGRWQDVPGGTDVVPLREHVLDPDRLVALLADADVVVAMRERTPLPAAVLSRLPALRLLVTTGMANSAIDVEAARELGITVCGTASDASGPAELTWALVLALARSVVAEDEAVRHGGWQRTVGTGLSGRTLGLLGLGRIGSRVARIGNAFGMHVLAWSTNLTAEAARDGGAELVGKDELLARSDVVSLHLRLSERTRGVLGASELAAMRSTALLVNTSRAGLVDQAALVAALRDGTIGGAGLDVFEHEPLPADSPLRTLPRTVLTPHLGYVTDATYRIFYGQAVENVTAFLAGQPLRVLAAPAVPQ
jgi:phosphoglycerate dehydrogenase-like enzyme